MALTFSNGKWQKAYEKTNYPTYANGGLKDKDFLPTNLTKIVKVRVGDDWEEKEILDIEKNNKNAEKNKEIEIENKLNKQKDKDNTAANAKGEKANALYDKVLTVAANTQGSGNYLTHKDNIQKLSEDAKAAGIDIKDMQNAYDSFYKTKIIGKGWDVNLAAKPPYGTFDSSYYLKNNSGVSEKWKEAVEKGDLDITAMYTNENIYALQHYTNVGIKSGKRGNAAEDLEAAKSYVESKPTDKEIQSIKDKQLGVTKEGVQAGASGTGLEGILKEYITEEATEKTAQFGALAQDILKEAIDKMKQAKEAEFMLDMLGGMGDFGEVINVNQSLAESLSNEIGAGGMFGFGGGTNTMTQNLEDSLSSLTGINTSTVYNWQDWFDKNIKKKYGITEGEKLTGTDGKQVEIDAEFAKDFIESYLVPRFNKSQSMSEFVEYVDVDEALENPFQTEKGLGKILEAVQQTGSVQSKLYLDEIKKYQDSYFDADFYFNPQTGVKSEEAMGLAGNKNLEEKYATQKKTVESDWEQAKKQIAAGSGYWWIKAYQYGADVNDKESFAKLHFQVKGQGAGYDAAADLWTPLKIQDYIYTKILPSVKDAAGKLSIFGEFLNPDDFADNILTQAGANPNDPSTWGDVLKAYKLSGFSGTYEELKDYISSSFKTVSALELKEQLKELEKKGIKPSQKNLGALYIEKTTDAPGTAEGETELFKSFQKAGYSGTEEAFYSEFFPDLDFNEQKLLTQLGSGKDLKFIDIDTDDPFSSFEAIDKLMGGEGFSGALSMDADEETKKKSSFFDLSSEEDSQFEMKDPDDFLSSFTSILKGF